MGNLSTEAKTTIYAWALMCKKKDHDKMDKSIFLKIDLRGEV